MEPWFGPEEKSALNEYMDEGGWLTEFKRTAEFEERIADYTGAKHAVVVNNGTISLTLMAMAAGVQAGDEVIVPNYTMIATPNSVKMFGAVPVFVDVEPETLCMEIDCVRKAITPKTKAIFLVPANGRYPKSGIAQFEELCRERNLLFLEDSAQSLGSWYPDGRHQGTAGLAGSFSFSAPKVISTGQGGALITNDDQMAFRLRRIKDFGRSGGGNDIHSTIGYNFKFTEMQAVIGNEQMKKLPWRVERKKEILCRYWEGLNGVNGIRFFEQDLSCTTPWFIDVLADSRDELSKYMKEQGIGSRVMYPPINRQEAYQQPGHYPVSELVGEKGLWLPSAAQLTDDEIDRICAVITDFYNREPMKVLILAGGIGSRLSEETTLKPKPMVEIGGKPILWHIMKIYSSFGFNDFVILCGYKGYLIKSYFANYYRHMADMTVDLANDTIEYHRNYAEPWKVTLIDTGLETMTGGRVKRAMEFVGNEPFMLTYGDGVADIDLNKVLEFHRNHGRAITMTSVQPEGRFGALVINNEYKVTNFKEKPSEEGAWINAGFFVCNQKVFDYIDDDRTIFERQPLENMAKDGELYTFKHTGFWKPMDMLRDKNELEQLWASGSAPWKNW